MGIGSTTPWGLLSVNPNGITGPAFVIGSSTATNFIVTNAGNVGIGMTPSNILDITKTQNAASVMQLTNANTGTAARTDLRLSNGTNLFLIANFGTSYTPSGLARTDGTLIQANGAGGLTLNTGGAYPIYFGTGDAERMRIDSTGNVGIGATSPSSALHVSAPSTPEGAFIRIDSGGANNRATGFRIDSTFGGVSQNWRIGHILDNTGNLGFIEGTNERFTIAKGGNVGIGDASPDALLDVKGTVCLDLNADEACTDNTAAISDARLKTNVTDITGGLSLVGQLRPVRFQWNGEYHTGTSTSLGFLAQEVEQVFPELVITDTAGYKNLDYSKLTAVLAVAVKELDARTKFIQNAATSTVLTVDVAGNVGIGTTTPNYKLTVAGDIAATAFVNTSTREAKTDVNYATASSSETMLDRLVNLKVATYRYKIEDQSDPLRIGFIAEDVQTIAPEILAPNGKGVDIYKLATFTLSGVQALATKLDAEHMRVTSLEVRVAALESGAVSSASGSPLALSSSTLASALEGFGVLIQKGIAQFNTLVFRQLVASKDADGTSSAGSVLVLTGNTVAQVNNSLVQPSTKVFVTFNSQIAGSWWVSDKTAGSFRVILSAPQPSDVSFDYFLVQTQGQIATSTPNVISGTVSQSSGPDTTAPVITLLGDNPVHVSVGGIFTDPGITVADNSGSTVPYVTFVNGIEQPVSAIDTGSQTTYIITYVATDAAGNSSTITRSVIVGSPSAPVTTASSTPSSTDTTAPVVTLTGAAAMQITVGDTFTDPGATAADDVDGSLTASIVVTGAVDTAIEGLYTLTYTATDAALNTASVSRVVTVAAAPTI